MLGRPFTPRNTGIDPAGDQVTGEDYSHPGVMTPTAASQLESPPQQGVESAAPRPLPGFLRLPSAGSDKPLDAPDPAPAAQGEAHPEPEEPERAAEEPPAAPTAVEDKVFDDPAPGPAASAEEAPAAAQATAEVGAAAEDAAAQGEGADGAAPDPLGVSVSAVGPRRSTSLERSSTTATQQLGASPDPAPSTPGERRASEALLRRVTSTRSSGSARRADPPSPDSAPAADPEPPPPVRQQSTASSSWRRPTAEASGASAARLPSAAAISSAGKAAAAPSAPAGERLSPFGTRWGSAAQAAVEEELSAIDVLLGIGGVGTAADSRPRPAARRTLSTMPAARRSAPAPRPRAPESPSGVEGHLRGGEGTANGTRGFEASARISHLVDAFDDYGGGAEGRGEDADAPAPLGEWLRDADAELVDVLLAVAAGGELRAGERWRVVAAGGAAVRSAPAHAAEVQEHIPRGAECTVGEIWRTWAKLSAPRVGWVSVWADPGRLALTPVRSAFGAENGVLDYSGGSLLQGHAAGGQSPGRGPPPPPPPSGAELEQLREAAQESPLRLRSKVLGGPEPGADLAVASRYGALRLDPGSLPPRDHSEPPQPASPPRPLRPPPLRRSPAGSPLRAAGSPPRGSGGTPHRHAGLSAAGTPTTPPLSVTSVAPASACPSAVSPAAPTRAPVSDACAEVESQRPPYCGPESRPAAPLIAQLPETPLPQDESRAAPDTNAAPGDCPVPCTTFCGTVAPAPPAPAGSASEVWHWPLSPAIGTAGRRAPGGVRWAGDGAMPSPYLTLPVCSRGAQVDSAELSVLSSTQLQPAGALPVSVAYSPDPDPVSATAPTPAPPVGGWHCGEVYFTVLQQGGTLWFEQPLSGGGLLRGALQDGPNGWECDVGVGTVTLRPLPAPAAPSGALEWAFASGGAVSRGVATFAGDRAAAADSDAPRAAAASPRSQSAHSAPPRSPQRRTPAEPPRSPQRRTPAEPPRSPRCPSQAELPTPVAPPPPGSPAAPAAAAATVVDGDGGVWVARTSKTYGRAYWVEAATGRRQWHHPLSGARSPLSQRRARHTSASRSHYMTTSSVYGASAAAGLATREAACAAAVAAACLAALLPGGQGQRPPWSPQRRAQPRRAARSAHLDTLRMAPTQIVLRPPRRRDDSPEGIPRLEWRVPPHLTGYSVCHHCGSPTGRSGGSAAAELSRGFKSAYRDLGRRSPPRARV